MGGEGRGRKKKREKPEGIEEREEEKVFLFRGSFGLLEGVSSERRKGEEKKGGPGRNIRY